MYEAYPRNVYVNAQIHSIYASLLAYSLTIIMLLNGHFLYSISYLLFDTIS